jgi:hypothetical protein
MIRRRWRWLVISLSFLSIGFLTACTVSLSGGWIGIVLGILSMGGLLFAGSSQSGCRGGCMGPCLSVVAPEVDAKIPVGPCLKIMPIDMGAGAVDAAPPRKPYLGPCLSVAVPPKKEQSSLETGGSNLPFGSEVEPETLSEGDLSAERLRVIERLVADESLHTDLGERLRPRKNV